MSPEIQKKAAEIFVECGYADRVETEPELIVFDYLHDDDGTVDYAKRGMADEQFWILVQHYKNKLEYRDLWESARANARKDGFSEKEVYITCILACLEAEA